MTDLRDKVKDERSFLKKIELAIPGFRGYRKREDLRIADSMLRDYLARILGDVERYVKDIRDTLSEAMLIDEIDDVGKIVNKVSEMVSEVRHAEQGYMGLVGDYRVSDEQLNRLYEFDYALIEDANALRALVKGISSQELSAMVQMLPELSSRLKDFESKFRKRRDYMLEVFS